MIDAEPIPEPTQRLAPAARAYWTAEAVPGAVVVVVLALVVRTVVADLADAFPRWLLDAVVALAGLAALVQVAVVPQLRWRRWRWQVRDEEVDLLHGRLTLRRTLVPIVRIQHVQTERTAIGRLFGVATVRFFTAAGTTAIPALPEAEAASIRDRVARQARVPDEL